MMSDITCLIQNSTDTIPWNKFMINKKGAGIAPFLCCMQSWLPHQTSEKTSGCNCYYYNKYIYTYNHNH